MSKVSASPTKSLGLLVEIKSLINDEPCASAEVIETDLGWILEFKTKDGVKVLASTRNPYHPKLYNSPNAALNTIKSLGLAETKVFFLKS
jgi:hypothetical protein